MFKSYNHPSDEHNYTMCNILEKCCTLFNEMFISFDWDFIFDFAEIFFLFIPTSFSHRLWLNDNTMFYKTLIEKK